MSLTIKPLQNLSFGESSFINSQSSKKVIEKTTSSIQKEPTLPEVKEFLDEILYNTKLTYTIDDEDKSFIIKVRDKKTDKIIKEIPSREMQSLKKHFKEHLGVLFNELI